MPTELLYPNGVSATGTGITVNGAASTWECIDDARAAYDDATTYVQLFHTSATNFRTTLSNLVGPAASIDWVNHESRAIKENAGGQDCLVYMRIGTTNYVVNTHSSTSWNTVLSANQTVSPDTSSPWTTVEIDAMLSSVETGGASGAYYTWCSAHNFQVSFVLPVGGAAWLLGSWLPPLIAAGIGAAPTMKELMSFFLPRGKFRIAPGGAHWREDFARIMEALQVRPVYIGA